MMQLKAASVTCSVNSGSKNQGINKNGNCGPDFACKQVVVPAQYSAEVIVLMAAMYLYHVSGRYQHF